MIPLVVLDTSVLLAGSFFATEHSPALEILVRLDRGDFALAMSVQLAAELRRKIRESGADHALADEHIARLQARAEVHADVEEVRTPIPVSETDRFLVALGRVTGAACIVSQDHHLTTAWGLNQAPPALTPGRFLRRLRELRGEPAPYGEADLFCPVR